MIFSIIVACVIAFAAIVCYSSCVMAGRADRQTEEYFALKEVERRNGKMK